MTDQELHRLLRESFEPVQDAAPSRDLWRAIATRRERRRVPPWVDVGIAAAVLAALLARPDWLIAVAYLF